METIGSFPFFLPASLLKMDMLGDLNGLLRFAGVEELVEQFYHFFRTELCRTDTAADKALFDDGHTLFDLGAVFLESLLGAFVGGSTTLLFPGQHVRNRVLAAGHERRIVRYDDEEAL